MKEFWIAGINADGLRLEQFVTGSPHKVYARMEEELGDESLIVLYDLDEWELDEARLDFEMNAEFEFGFEEVA